MSSTYRYCYSCKKTVTVADDDQRCPECGDQLSQNTYEPTIHVSDATKIEGADETEPPPGPDQFVGLDFDKYHIERFLGQGGMARVYLAMHKPLERLCAIKILRETTKADAAAIELFLSEARTAAALVHPNVVTIHNVGHELDRHFIEMEYVDGQSLADVVRARGKLDLVSATRYMLQISSALAAAHAMDLIHRDVKPANVMMSSHGAKLADFGLAKGVVDKKKSAARKMAGTPHYMAPELFGGSRASKQTDVYAMGVSYFMLLTGGLPLTSNSLSELVRIQTRPEPLNINELCQELPRRVSEVLQQCLARNPEDRYRDASELEDALRLTLSTTRSLRSLLEEALANDPMEIRGEASHFSLDVPLADSRSQTVHIELDQAADDRDEIIRIFSICGPAQASYYEKALELNPMIAHGSIGLEVVDGELCFIMMNAYPRPTCDPEEIRHSVIDIAEHSDRVEQLLTGEDRY